MTGSQNVAPAAARALGALRASRRRDGAWGIGPSSASADVRTTTFAVLAFTEAGFIDAEARDGGKAARLGPTDDDRGALQALLDDPAAPIDLAARAYARLVLGASRTDDPCGARRTRWPCSNRRPTRSGATSRGGSTGCGWSGGGA